jgi:two-component sensor histidine kinase
VELQYRERAHPASADGLAQADFKRELAHRLGNLLQVVNGNLELLTARVEDEQLRGYLRNAKTAAQQLTEIAHGLVSQSAEEP